MLKWMFYFATAIFLSSCQSTAYNPGYIISETTAADASAENQSIQEP